MYKHQKDVQRFMYTFGQRYRNKPEIPTPEELKLSCKLLLSEVLEYCMACGIEPTNFDFSNPNNPTFNLSTFGNPCLEDMVDALGDIQYVNDWAANCIGVDLEPIADEIQRSNMTKVWNITDLNDMKPGYKAEGNLITGYVVKDEHGKIMKPKSYSPADIQHQLKLQGATEL